MLSAREEGAIIQALKAGMNRSALMSWLSKPDVASMPIQAGKRIK